MSQESLAPQEYLESQEDQEKQARRDHQDLQDPREDLVFRDPPASLASLGREDFLACQECPASRVRWVLLGPSDLRVTRAPRVFLVQRVLKESKEGLDHLDLEASPGKREKSEYQGSLDPLVGTVCQA